MLAFLQSKITHRCLSFQFTIILVILITGSNTAFAQKFYAATYGGDNGYSTLISANADGSDYKEMRFGVEQPEYYSTYGRLIQHSNGKIYGITVKGGIHDSGYVFEFDPSTGELDVELDVYYYHDGYQGSNLIEYEGKLLHTSDSYLRSHIETYDPNTNELNKVIRIPNGSTDLTLVGSKIYGFTQHGGGGWAGSIYEVDLATNEYTFLQDFEYTSTRTGRFPQGKPVYYNGKLYGVTMGAGEHGGGTLFEYDLTTHEFKKLNDFKKDAIGRVPNIDLERYENFLIGRISTGGSNNKGTIFSYDITTNTIQKLKDLTYNEDPQAIRNINGVLYGFSDEGNGMIYTLDPVTGEMESVYDFTNSNNGGIKPIGIVSISEGNVIWGLTKLGGSANGGVLFSYNLSTSEYNEYFSFNDITYGKKVRALEYTHGKLYGVSILGGANNSGTIFSYDTATKKLNVEYDFPSAYSLGEYFNDYNYENGKLTQFDVDGDHLYGFLQHNLYEYNVASKQFETLYAFPQNTDIKGVAMQGDHVTGLTSNGGNANQGIWFLYNKSTDSFQIVEHLSSENSTKIHAVGSYEGGMYVVKEYANAFHLTRWNVVNNSFEWLASVPSTDQEGRHGYCDLIKSGGGKLAFNITFSASSGNSHKSYLYTLSTNTITQLPVTVNNKNYLTEEGFYFDFGFFNYDQNTRVNYFNRRISNSVDYEYIVDIHVFSGQHHYIIV